MVMERIAEKAEAKEDIYNINDGQTVSNETIQGKALIIIGSVVSVTVLGLTIYKIKKMNKK